MAAEIVIAVYKPRPGMEKALLEILRRHVPTLRKEKLATERPVVLMRSREGGHLLEVFEWATATAADEAHTNPRVMEVWGAMEPLCDFVKVGDVPEVAARFPHFEPVDGVVR
jgi:hypothetical protein